MACTRGWIADCLSPGCRRFMVITDCLSPRSGWLGFSGRRSLSPGCDAVPRSRRIGWGQPPRSRFGELPGPLCAAGESGSDRLSPGRDGSRGGRLRQLAMAEVGRDLVPGRVCKDPGPDPPAGRRGPGSGGFEEPGEGEGEGGAATRGAGDGDLASKHLRETPAEGEPQAGAAVLAVGGGVGLGEGLEQAR